MNVKLSLHSPEVMRAFAVFLNTAADAKEAALKDPTRNRGFGLGALVGDTDRATNPLWQTSTYTGQNDAPVQESEYTPPTLPSVLNETSVQQAVKRERGKPSPGRARRTKEEIAEDEAAEREEAATKPTFVTNTPRVGEPNDPRREQSMTAAQAEELKAPVVSGSVDSPEVEAQDKADEQAEVEANRNPEKPLTTEDLRGVMGEYVRIYGMAAAQADGPVIFNDALGAPPTGEDKWKLSLVPEGKIAAAVAAWKGAIESNPFDRAKVA